MRNIKIIIMKTKPLVSDQEVESYMDFNGLMKSYQAHQKAEVRNRWTKTIYWISGSVVVLTFLLFLYLNSLPSTSSIEPSDSVPVFREPNSSENKSLSDSLAVFEKPTESNFQKPDKSEKTTKQESKSSVKIQSEATTTTEPLPYVPASPKDGYEALYRYLNDAIAYPAESLKDSVQGVTTVSFIINPDGKVERISVEQSLGPAFDREAIRVIGQMPEWNPALLNGKPVPSKLSLPLTFQIKKIEQP